MLACYSLRQPTTPDASDFWFISKRNWDVLLVEGTNANKKAKKVALNNLRKFDAAGCIM